MIRTLLVVGLAMLVTGCVDVTATAGTDGRPTYTIDCNGEPDGCFTKAGELCPRGYYLLDRKEGTSEVPYTAGVIAAPHTRLLIECKLP